MNSIGTEERYCYFRRRMKNIDPTPGFRPPQSLVLVGMMGAGKSTIGRLLALRLGLPFYDADIEIEAETGLLIKDIFEQRGEAAFRDLEHEMITRLLTTASLCVIATGGGAFVQPRNHSLMQQHGLTIWLKADLDLLAERTARRNTRPLLNGQNPRAKLAELLALREPIYKTARLSLEMSNSPAEVTAERVYEAVKQYVEYEQ